MRYIYFINTVPYYTMSPEAACIERNQYWVNYYNSQPNQPGTHSFRITNVNLFDGGLNGTGFGGSGMLAYMVGTCEFEWIISTPQGDGRSSGSISLWMEPPICPSGFRFILATLMCDDGATPPPPPRPPSHTYTVEIRPVGRVAESSSVLASVEPRNATSYFRNHTVQLMAQVRDETGSFVADASVSILAQALQGSGGHAHHDSSRPAGTLHNTDSGAGGPGIIGSTGPTGGGFVFFFTAPEVSGDHVLEARCPSYDCTHEGPKGVWVGVRGLQPIGIGPWGLTGSRWHHPNNHFLSTPALLVLQQLGAHWRRLYVPFGPVFTVNDASLERGGLFDCCETWTDIRGVSHSRAAEGWWTPPHSEHRHGTVVDIGGIRPEDEEEFQLYAARDLGAIALPHVAGTGPHFHVRLMGVAE